MTQDRKRCLITGISGLLGSSLAEYFENRFRIFGTYYRNPVNLDRIEIGRCDLTNFRSVEHIINEFNPQIVIHCAALTDIDTCEVDKKLAYRTNVEATAHIVHSVRDKSVKLVYISTDAVYDGVKGGFSEADTVAPQNYYGQSKYEGELEALQKENALILRTNIFGWNIRNKKSLGEWILHALHNRQGINGYQDAYFSSIYTMELARIIDMAIEKNLSGIYNCGSMDSCSKYEFGLKIADRFRLDRALITPISIDDFQFNTKRGKNLSLNVERIQNALCCNMPTVDYCIEAFHRDYHSIGCAGIDCPQ